MELRVLQYFLAVAREQSISGAAESLFLSQPTLSRQLKELEEELGKTLFVRGNRRVTLTEEGMLLKKRAEEITELVKKAKDEISLTDDIIAGDITVGAGETDGVRYLAKAAKMLRKKYPLVHLHIISGDTATVTDDLDRGLIDFGLIFGDVDLSKYRCISLPYRDSWGVLMRRDDPLAQLESIRSRDLEGKPLIVSRQAFESEAFSEFFRESRKKLDIIATYNLLFNGSIMVDEGMGYAVTFDKLINVTGESNLCFRPLEPRVEANMSIIWKKYQVLTKAADCFIQTLHKCTEASTSPPNI